MLSYRDFACLIPANENRGLHHPPARRPYGQVCARIDGANFANFRPSARARREDRAAIVEQREERAQCPADGSRSEPDRRHAIHSRDGSRAPSLARALRSKLGQLPAARVPTAARLSAMAETP
jgi:hypothetical protein